MRKLFFALATMFFMAGLVVATEVTVVSYDKEKKEVKVKDGDNEKTYKISDKCKVTVTTGKAGEEKTTDGTVEDLEKRLSFTGGKGGKGGGGKGGKGFATKLDITTDGDTITAVKYRGFGGFKKKDN